MTARTTRSRQKTSEAATGPLLRSKAAQLADPTGCGDAYRAGLLLGLQKNLDWPTTGRIASLAGAIKIEHHGTQHHHYDWPAFAARFQQNFGSKL